MASSSSFLKAIRHAAEASVAILAIGYTLGFLTWSFYALSLGLGFMRLASQQYLVAGELLAFFLALLITPDWVLSKAVWKHYARKPDKLGPRARRVIAEVVVKAVAGFIALGALQMLANVIPVLDKTAVFKPTNVVAFCVAPSLLFLILLGSISWSRRPGKEVPKEKSPKLVPRGLGGSFASAGIMLLLGIVVFPVAFLPHMPQAFGGAQPRLAYLEIAPGDLSPETSSKLFNETGNQTGTARTVLLSVLYDGPDGMLVRTAANAGPRDPLYEITAQVIRAKVWVS